MRLDDRRDHDCRGRLAMAGAVVAEIYQLDEDMDSVTVPAGSYRLASVQR